MHVGKGIYLGLICKQVTAGAVVGLTCKVVGMKCCRARTFKAVGWGASRTVLVTTITVMDMECVMEAAAPLTKQ
jgi:hypothetical protein